MIYLLKKLLTLFKKILLGKVKLKYGVPKGLNIFVYNSESMTKLKYVLKGKKFIILDFRIEQIKKFIFH